MRQLILCCDGTNNNLTGGVSDTSVVKLRELLAAQGDSEQRFYYDPGVGNAGELPGATFGEQMRRRGERIAGLAFGRGVYENIAQAYRFLMREYREGDQIFVFGFSRGAFTARSVGGMVNLFGVLRPDAQSMVPTLLHVYFSNLAPVAPVARKGAEHAQRGDVARQIRRIFGHPGAQGDGHVAVHFTGVWDTVASVGMWPFGLKFTAKPDLAGKHFVHVRQALALDEMRAQFTPRIYAEENGSFECAKGFGQGTLTQLWFRGSHCDVGGGYTSDQATLALTPLAWLLSQAEQMGLRLKFEGQPLNSEAAVLAALQAYQPPLDSGGAPPRIHNELHSTPLWALTGMAVRRPDRVLVDAGEDPQVQPVEHPSVAEWRARFPQDTVWSKWRLGRADLAVALLFVLIALLMGRALAPQGGGWAAAQAFGNWQVGWWWPAEGWHAVTWPVGVSNLLWALLLDLPFIVCWAWLLSLFATRAFARRAGLRRAHSPFPALLNLLGWSLTLAVFADLGEDLFSALTLGLLSYGHATWASVTAALMSACSAAKWLGLAAALMLILWGLLPARRE